MGRKVDVEDLVGAAEINSRLKLSRSLAHSWLRSYPAFPRPVARLVIGHVWNWPDVEAWAAEMGRGRWDQLPPGLDGDKLVPLQAWAKEHDVPPGDLVELAGEGLLLLAKRGGRWYLDPTLAAGVWDEHGDGMLAKHLVMPRRRQRVEEARRRHRL